MPGRGRLRNHAPQPQGDAPPRNTATGLWKLEHETGLEPAPPGWPGWDIHFDRRDDAGSRHAGAHGLGQVAGSQYLALPGFQIGRNRAKLRRQQVEVVDPGNRHRFPAQDLRKLLALDQAAWHAQSPALDAERKAHEEFPVVLLAPKAHVPARRTVAEGFVPVRAFCQFLDRRRRHAGGI
jgi:hypothetical protein